MLFSSVTSGPQSHSHRCLSMVGWLVGWCCWLVGCLACWLAGRLRPVRTSFQVATWLRKKTTPQVFLFSVSDVPEKKTAWRDWENNNHSTVLFVCVRRVSICLVCLVFVVFGVALLWYYLICVYTLLFLFLLCIVLLCYCFIYVVILLWIVLLFINKKSATALAEAWPGRLELSLKSINRDPTIVGGASHQPPVYRVYTCIYVYIVYIV